MIGMDAQELLLRERVHHAYDALDARAPTTVAVLRRVQSRVERRGRSRAWIGGAVALVAASVVGIQFVPRSARVQLPNAVVHRANALSYGAYDGAGPGGASNGQEATQGRIPLTPCAQSDLAVAVSTDHSVYGMGDVVTVSASVTNRSHMMCLRPEWSSVTVKNAYGTVWELCPEIPPQPTPTPEASLPTQPKMYEMAPEVPAPNSAAMIADEFAPGQSDAVVCTWHTQYRTLSPGTYWASATWSGVSGTAHFTLLQLDPTATPNLP